VTKKTRRAACVGFGDGQCLHVLPGTHMGSERECTPDNRCAVSAGLTEHCVYGIGDGWVHSRTRGAHGRGQERERDTGWLASRFGEF